MMMYGRRRRLSPAETAANAAKREARKQAALTCQCCGLQYLANTGTIAHHGYQRPGWGFQTASCMGAKYVPFEVSRDRLGEMLVALKAHLERTQGILADVQAEAVTLAFEYADKSKPKTGNYRERWATTIVRVTRENFAEALATAQEVYPFGGRITKTFDDLKASRIAELNGDIKMTESAITLHTGRFNRWTQTKRRFDGQWVNV